ncbi:MAG: efflux transporter outer membrane subunit [Gemmatimonadota bacterium]|nr:MAG: efflux transporter outer membrane subunit [Gemmatimonadota bacterium]
MRHPSLLLLVTTLLSGCLVGPNYERPDTPEPERYRESTVASDTVVAETMPPVESVADLPWWELFQDTVLQDLIATALENNRDLKVAMARIAEARAALGFSKADLYPTVDAIAGGTLDANTEDDVTASGVVAGTVFWEADLFGRIRRSNEAALNDLLATEEAYRGVTIALVAQVADFYLLLRDLDNRLAISEATVQARAQSLDIIQVRFSAGMVSEVDVNQAEIQLAEAEAAVEAFQRLRTQTENGISFLLGQPPTDIGRGVGLGDQAFPPDLPAGLPSDLLERRPDILAAERQLAAQTARIGVAEAIKYPSLTLSADMGASFASVTTGFLTLGANLLAPIFNAGKNQRRVEIEAARTEQLFHAYEQTVLNALREVEDAMVAVHRYDAEYATRLRQVEAARSAADLSWVRYDGGWTSFLEVLEVQRSLFAAELAASETLQLRHTSMVQLYRALGGGWNVQDAQAGQEDT